MPPFPNNENPRPTGFRAFGYATEDGGNLRALDEQLRAVVDGGFEYAELDSTAWEVWYSGRVNGTQLARWVDVLDRFRDRLSYTLHGPFDVNLFDWVERDLHARLLRSAIQVARAVDADIYVYHPGRRLPMPTGAIRSMLETMSLERAILGEIAEEVADTGCQVAVETWMPYDEYSYAVWPEQLAQQIEAIDHPSIGVCLDSGHLYLSAHWFGFDYLSAVERLAPLVNHLHLQDLFAAYSPTGAGPLGKGDLHLPLGWGEIPFDAMFSRFAFPREPVFMVEISPKFIAYTREMMEECTRLAGLRDSVGDSAVQDRPVT